MKSNSVQLKSTFSGNAWIGALWFVTVIEISPSGCSKCRRQSGNLSHTCVSVCAAAAFHSSLFLERHSSASHLLLSSSSALRRSSSFARPPPLLPSGATAAPTQRLLPRSLSHLSLAKTSSDCREKQAAFVPSVFTRSVVLTPRILFTVPLLGSVKHKEAKIKPKGKQHPSLKPNGLPSPF